MKTLRRLLCGLALASLVWVLSAFAQERSYEYASIRYSFSVNEDSTVDVEETQTYDFRGAYHVGWRNIPLKGVSSISDIEVFDGEGGAPLRYSPSRLDKNNPASWGRYTTFVENGEQNIEWYYDVADAFHTWTLRYKLHGAIAFYEDHDEFYWNLFTNFNAPIREVSGELVLPKKVDDESYLTQSIYVDRPGERFEGGDITPDQRFVFFAGNFPPNSVFTVAMGWPKGVVPYSAYVTDLIWGLWGWWLGVLLVLCAALWVYYIQVVLERRQGRETIVPEYAPPEHLPPAQAEILVKERLTPKAWSATVVDLAIRGHLTIEEQESFSLMKTTVLVISVLVFSALSFVVFLAFSDFFVANLLTDPALYVLLISVLPAIILFVHWARRGGKLLSSKEYVLHRVKTESKPGEMLQDYEREFLGTLFSSGEAFSTKAMKKSPSKSRAFGMSMSALSKKLYKETEEDTGAYASSFSRWQKVVALAALGILFLGVLSANLGLFTLLLPFLDDQGVVLLTLLFVAVVIALLGWFNPRLNQKGQLLKESWLGFIMYLEIAERYRLQNLTPELFEKYLPYAMIFGIEKEWAKAFAAVNMPQPSWYHSGSLGGGSVLGNTASSTSFSPGAFASGFSASFASSFSGAGGGGGASGGGGGAGGGGGGGGGGAG